MPAAIPSASSTTSGAGPCPGGEAIATSIPASAPASSSECATFEPPSPTKASRRPARPPNRSRTVSTSASAWHGWCSSESAFTTGTAAATARSSSSRWAYVRTTIASQYAESALAVSATGSPRPSWSSSGRSTIGFRPSRAAAAANETRVRVEGFAK